MRESCRKCAEDTDSIYGEKFLENDECIQYNEMCVTCEYAKNSRLKDANFVKHPGYMLFGDESPAVQEIVWQQLEEVCGINRPSTADQKETQENEPLVFVRPDVKASLEYIQHIRANKLYNKKSADVFMNFFEQLILLTDRITTIADNVSMSLNERKADIRRRIAITMSYLPSSDPGHHYMLLPIKSMVTLQLLSKTSEMRFGLVMRYFETKPQVCGDGLLSLMETFLGVEPEYMRHSFNERVSIMNGLLMEIDDRKRKRKQQKDIHHLAVHLVKMDEQNKRAKFR